MKAVSAVCNANGEWKHMHYCTQSTAIASVNVNRLAVWTGTHFVCFVNETAFATFDMIALLRLGRLLSGPGWIRRRLSSSIRSSCRT